MKLLLFAALLATLVSPRGNAAQYPLGSVAATYPYIPSKLLADPVRNRVYAADTTSNSVIVIDTTTLQVIATIPIGSDPVDMAISRDGNTLYVANSGSTLAAVGVVNLNTLAAESSFSLPGTGLAVAAGLSNRVYASATTSQDQSAIYQLDGTAGTVQATFNPNEYDNNLFQISPDGTTLFVANTGVEPGTLETFDVSTATASAAQTNSQASDFCSQLVISPNGMYICLPSGGGNPGAPSYSTSLFSTANINTSYGSFSNGAYPGPLAFSPDSSLVYQTRSGNTSALDEFSTQTFLLQQEVSLPTVGQQGYSDTINSIVSDNTGSYLFVAESSFDGTSTTGLLAVLTTGSGTLTPSSVEPVITSSLNVNATQGTPFTYQITASGSPTSYNATSLPDGLTVNTTTGVISGTPTGDGYYESTITATNASGSATADVQFDVQEDFNPPVFTTTSLPAATLGSAYSATVVATGSPYEYDASGLPAGLSQDANSGVISGVPTQSGVFSVTLDAINDYGEAEETIPLTVNLPVPVITSATKAMGMLGIPFTYVITATNTPTSFTASGLPSGLSVDAATGVISGTPSVVGTNTVTISAVNSYGTGTANLTLTISYPVPVITSVPAATTQMDEPFTFQVVASNAPIRYAASGLPPGLAINSASGLISGKPAMAGNFTVSLSAANTTGTGTATLSLAVNALLQPIITSPGSVTATQKEPFNYLITASNLPSSFSATGLPEGLHVDTNNGLISGVPLTLGNFVVHLSVANGVGVGIATLHLTVGEERPLVTLVDTVPAVMIGTGHVGKVTVKLSTALKRPLVVHYRIRGGAVDGTDYKLLTGTVRFTPGKRSKPIRIIPMGDLDGAKEKVVKIRLENSPDYTIGTKEPSSVTIRAGE